MKIKVWAMILLVASVGSCGPGEEPEAEAGNSSYEFKFLSGSLAGKEYKAANLSREKVLSMYTEEPGSNLKGIVGQVMDTDFLVGSTIALTSGNDAMAFKPPGSEQGSNMVLSFSENGTDYTFSSVSGSPVLRNLKIATIGSNGGASLGLTTYELTFDNALFSDQGNTGNEAVRVSGKLTIR